MLLLIGTAVVALLLLRFAFDFTAGMPLLLSVPFWGLVVTSVGVAAVNLVSARLRNGEAQMSAATRAALLFAIPAGFLASSFDCTGLAASGCSPLCTFVKLGWIPLLAACCAALFFTGKRWLQTVITVAAFLPLAPHCVCYNVGNAWWIDRLGASPTCYAWGGAASLVALTALRAGGRVWPSLIVCAAIIGGSTAFFISHHYFQFPW